MPVPGHDRPWWFPWPRPWGHTCRSARPYHQAAGVSRRFGVRGFVHVAPTHARRLSRFGGREFASQDTSSLGGQASLRPFQPRADLATSYGPAGTTFPPVQSVRSVCSGFGGFGFLVHAYGCDAQLCSSSDSAFTPICRAMCQLLFLATPCRAADRQHYRRTAGASRLTVAPHSLLALIRERRSS